MRTIAIAGAMVALVACGTVDEKPRGSASVADTLFGQVAARRAVHVGSQFWTPQTLAESLPNQRFVQRDGSPLEFAGRPFTFSEVVLVGTVVKVEVVSRVPGEVDDVEELDGDHGADGHVQTDAPNWAIVSLDVEEAVGSPAGGVRTLKFGLGGFKEPRAVAAALGSIGRVIFVADSDGEYLYPVEQGALIGQVADDGSVAFPALASEQDEFVDGLDTVAEILQEASTPARKPISVFS